MPLSLTLRPFRRGDQKVVYRPEDEAECRADGGGPCWTAVLTAHQLGCVDVAVNTQTGTPVAFFGCVPMGEGAGSPWMLATPELPRHAKALQRLTQGVLADWHEKFPVLTNHVDARNALHIHWLRRWGFQFTGRHRLGGELPLPFLEFVRYAPGV